MSKHTPGPWTTQLEDPSDPMDPITNILDSTGCELGWVWDSDGRSYDETIANAKLIAAAPEMAEEIERLLKTNSRYWRDILEWVQLAERQYAELPHNSPICPTQASINRSRRLIGQLRSAETSFPTGLEVDEKSDRGWRDGYSKEGHDD